MKRLGPLVDPHRRAALAAALALSPLGARWAQAQAVAAPNAAESSRAPLPRPGDAITLVDTPLLDGSSFRARDADGRVLVLYWWASTCPFCALQSPEMEKLWRKERARGLAFLGLSIDRSPDDARAYLQKKGYTWPSAFVTPELARALPKPFGLPITVVRGRDGRVLQAERGQLFPEDVEQMARWLV
jgi:thiol-disulfide isomerase/thioredoxin